MRNLLSLIIAIVFFTTNANAQVQVVKTKIDESYVKNANVIVLDDHTELELLSRDRLVVRKHKKVMVLNERGSNYALPYLGYDKRRKVSNIDATYYDKNGKKIKQIPKRKFIDQSAISDFSLYEDDRVLYYNEPPLSYPYTLIFSYEYETSNTLYLPQWNPVNQYAVSVLNSEFVVKNPMNFEFNLLKTNFEQFDIKEKLSPTNQTYSVRNIAAKKKEDYSLPLHKTTPNFKLSPKKFTHEGIAGEFNSWIDVGKWIREKLLSGQNNLPIAAIEDVKKLVSGVDNELEKVRLIYEYMQKRCRYISVQIGIGGWKPMSAEKVHNLGYGDCKALVNYAQSLLTVANIPSYYTIVYAGRSPKNIDKNFLSLQGNHAILCVPLGQDTVWLECTSTNSPAGYIAGFTDDRDVLTVFQDGGKIVHTKKYEDNQNIETTKASCRLGEDGTLKIEAKIDNQGSYYGRSNFLLSLKNHQVEEYYKNLWNLPGMILASYKFSEDKENQIIYEDLSIEMPKYVNRMGDILLIKPYVFSSQSNLSLNSKLEKESSFYLKSSINKKDVFELELPENMTFTDLPENKNLEFEFASYSIKIEKINERKARLIRDFSQKKGKYPKEEYDNYVKLKKAIKKNDNINIIINENK